MICYDNHMLCTKNFRTNPSSKNSLKFSILVITISTNFFLCKNFISHSSRPNEYFTCFSLIIFNNSCENISKKNLRQELPTKICLSIKKTNRLIKLNHIPELNKLRLGFGLIKNQIKLLFAFHIKLKCLTFSI